MHTFCYMLDKRLDQLSSYIEKIDTMSPTSIITEGMKNINDIIDTKNLNEHDQDFSRNLSLLIQDAAKKQIDETFLIQVLSQHLIHLIRRKMIYEHASKLGIERSLYKDEMKILFKGKFK